MALDLSKIKKKYDKLFTNGLPIVEKVSTQNVGLDYILSGGLPLGRLSMIYGPSSAGKSTTSLGICKAFIDQGYNVAYVDAERTVSDSDFKRLGIKMDDVPILRPQHAEQAIEFITDVAELGASLVVVDSIPALEPKARLEKLEGDPAAAEMAVKARFYAGLQGLLVPLCESHNMTVLFINQVRQSIGTYGHAVSVPGGSALKFMCTCMIELKGSTRLLEGSDRIKTNFVCTKNKVGPKGLSVEIEIGPEGLDSMSAFTSLLVKEKLIKTAGSVYSFTQEASELLKLSEDNLKIAVGMSRVRNFFSKEENKLLYDCLYGEIISRSQTRLPDVESIEE
jgi:protein RecA